MKIIKTIFRHTLVIVFFAMIAILFTMPLITQFHDHIIGGYGDNLYFAWLVSWYERIFTDGLRSPFFNPNMNFPQGWNLSTTDTSLASVMPGSIVSVFLGPIAGYNLAMLLTFVLSGWTMYLWTYHNTRNNLASVLAGSIFMVLPYRMAHMLMGHLNLSGTQWIPLFFLGLQGLIQGGMRKFQAPILAALALGLISFTSMYYLYMTLLIGGVFALILLVLGGWRTLKSASWWIEAIVFVLIVIPLIYVSMRPFIRLADSGVITNRDWTYINSYSASPLDFLLPSTDHFLVGHWVGANFNRELWPEVTLFVGFVSLGLFIYWLAAKPKGPNRAVVIAAIFASITAFIFALGPTLHWNGQAILKNPADPESYIYLPAYWAIHKLPFFDRMRAIARFGLFPGILGAFISGVSLSLLMSKIHKVKAWMIALLLLFLALFEFYPGTYAQYSTKIEPRAVDQWLAAQSKPSPVVYFPVDTNQDQFNIFATYYNKQPFFGGLFSANKPEQYLYNEELIARFPTEESIARLREFGFVYALVDVAAYPDINAVQQALAGLGVHPVNTISGFQIYDLRP